MKGINLHLQEWDGTVSTCILFEILYARFIFSLYHQSFFSSRETQIFSFFTLGYNPFYCYLFCCSSSSCALSALSIGLFVRWHAVIFYVILLFCLLFKWCPFFSHYKILQACPVFSLFQFRKWYLEVKMWALDVGSFWDVIASRPASDSEILQGCLLTHSHI